LGLLLAGRPLFGRLLLELLHLLLNFLGVLRRLLQLVARAEGGLRPRRLDEQGQPGEDARRDRQHGLPRQLHREARADVEVAHLGGGVLQEGQTGGGRPPFGRPRERGGPPPPPVALCVPVPGGGGLFRAPPPPPPPTPAR